ncbi:hypothetical protein PALB_4950 [Pseudoalteromonas luteoviolacea B = ATCC 29581]|nr:hypothetical protein PALB_4950 [Pseudoalteromonas luteoviolacea B = ATCC 29581]
MSLNKLGYFQKLRLEFIEFRLEYYSFISRKDLIDQFEIGPASASRDLAIYIELAPNNLVLRHESKQYFRSSDFSPIFNHERQQVLASLINGFVGLSIGKKSEEYKFVDSRPIEDFDLSVLGLISRGLHSNEKVVINRELFTIKCVSLSLDGKVTVALHDDKNFVDISRHMNELQGVLMV